MKYSKEFKLECVMKHKNGIYIPTPNGFKQRDSFLNQVRKWVKMYNSLGEVGLEHGTPTPPIELRIELIEQVENGESYTSVAYSAGIGVDLLAKWHRIYMEKGIDGLKSLKRGRPTMSNKKPKKDKTKSELEQLQEELEYLRAENAYLKKLSALVQKRQAQEQKKKS